MSLSGGLLGFGPIATVSIADDLVQIASGSVTVSAGVYRLATASADNRVATASAQTRLVYSGDDNLATDS